MPWSLTASLDGGDMQPTAAELKVVYFVHQSGSRKLIRLIWEYGNTVNGVWEAVPIPDGVEHQTDISGDDYDSAITHMSLDGELSFAATKRGAYEWLFSKGLIPAGTIT